MRALLECDTCTDSTTGIQSAIAHVNANPGHSMTGTDEEGTTTRVSTDPYEPDTDEYDGEDGDWRAGE